MSEENEDKDVERIKPEDLFKLKEMESDVKLLVTQAELAAAQAKNADLARASFISHIFIKYGMSFGDTFEPDGKIVRQQKNSDEELTPPKKRTTKKVTDKK